jgi:predicted O-methyltransferase YrrM
MTKYTIELDEEEIEIVKRIFTDFNHQQSLHVVEHLAIYNQWAVQRHLDLAQDPLFGPLLKGILDQILNPKYD